MYRQFRAAMWRNICIVSAIFVPVLSAVQIDRCPERLLPTTSTFTTFGTATDSCNDRLQPFGVMRAKFFDAIENGVPTSQLQDKSYTIDLGNNITVVMEHWKATRRYHLGFSSNCFGKDCAGRSTATVKGLEKGVSYRYALYQYTSDARWLGHKSSVTINVQPAVHTSITNTSAPTRTGTFVARPDGTAKFQLSRVSHCHIAFSGLAVSKICPDLDTTAAPATTPKTTRSTTTSTTPKTTRSTTTRMPAVDSGNIVRSELNSLDILVITIAVVVVVAGAVVVAVTVSVCQARRRANIQKSVIPMHGSDIPPAPTSFSEINSSAVSMESVMSDASTGSSAASAHVLQNIDISTPPKKVVLYQRTFATSNYKRFYDTARPANFQHNLLHAVEKMIAHYASRINPGLDESTLKDGVDRCMKKLQDDAFRNNEELQNDVGAVAEYLWTSAKEHDILNRMELCSVLNAVIRDDIAEEIQVAVVIFRGINSRRGNRNTADSVVDPSYPCNGETWRGGGFRNEFKSFFKGIRGKKYRVPGFLATTNKKEVAEQFAFKSDVSHPCAVWRIKFDRRGKNEYRFRVQHMAFVSKTLIPGEGEYLFAPYSVFKLKSVKWSTVLRKPHEFVIEASIDNQQEDENLCLTPWY